MMHASMGDAVSFITLVVLCLGVHDGRRTHDIPIRSRLLITYLSLPIFAQTFRERQHDGPTSGSALREGTRHVCIEQIEKKTRLLWGVESQNLKFRHMNLQRSTEAVICNV